MQKFETSVLLANPWLAREKLCKNEVVATLDEEADSTTQTGMGL